MSNKNVIITIAVCSILISVLIISHNRYQYVDGMVFDKLTGNEKTEWIVTKTDDAVYALGGQALDIADQCIENKIDAYEAGVRIDIICSRLENLNIKNENIIIYSDISFLGRSLYSYSNALSGGTLDDVRNDRNVLAIELGQDER